MVLHCALRGRRLEGPRFVWDVPGSSPAIPSKSLIFPRVFADLSIIVRFSEVGFLFEIGAVARKRLVFPLFLSISGMRMGVGFF